MAHVDDWRPKGRGRGVLGLQSWSPARRPHPSPPSLATAQTTVQQVETGEKKMLAKYSYKANTESPLGQTELDLTQKEEVVYIRRHPAEELWAFVRRSDGGEGYVPFSYLYDLNASVTGMPWLESKKEKLEAEVESLPKPTGGTYKPYVSAYSREQGGGNSGGSGEEKYRCDLCNKDFNGPLPLQAHMSSKAHREEVELLSDYS